MGKHNRHEISIVAGAHNIDLNEETQQKRGAAWLFSHMGFSFKTGQHDICLIELIEPLIFNEFVKPGPIDWNTPKKEYFGGAEVIGWGDTHEKPERKTLYSVCIEIVDDRNVMKCIRITQ